MMKRMLHPLQKIIGKPFISFIYKCRDILGGTNGKETCLSLPVPPANTGDIRDVGSIPGSGRSLGEGQSNPLQYSCERMPWTDEPGRL